MWLALRNVAGQVAVEPLAGPQHHRDGLGATGVDRVRAGRQVQRCSDLPASVLERSVTRPACFTTTGATVAMGLPFSRMVPSGRMGPP